jgi:hypothetical protein
MHLLPRLYPTQGDLMTKPRLRMAAVALSAALVGAGVPAVTAALDGNSAADARAGAEPQARPYVETHLLFGTARPDGGTPVTEAQFREFVDEFITPRFPDGLTVREAYGQYRDRHGAIERERSYELYLLYPTSRARAEDHKIEQIREAYNDRFQQESVARVDESARVDF